MSVRPVDIVSLQQMNEVSNIRQSENMRPMHEQMNIAAQEQKTEQVKAEQVNKKDDTDNQSKKYDAKDKSSNEYYSDGSPKNKKGGGDGVVRIKSLDGGGFDIKV